MVNCPYSNKKNGESNALNEISSELACEYDYLCDDKNNCVRKQKGMPAVHKHLTEDGGTD